MHDFTPLSGLAGGALIGLAAALLMLLTGRIAGVTGIVGGALQVDTADRSADRSWRIAFIAGLIAAPLIAALFGAPLPRPAMHASLVVVAIAGALVGFGTRMGNGCTSGHGVCGFARLSGRSIAATCIFMLTAIATVAIVRHGIGG
ncbi:YeeE/YedE thiosulfate transporter family protein [Bradyrhizobium sp. UFLA01-814]|uniref:YeeE/YedE family protein n=1 Tax=Bradyrhizobium sp. UFLA01-814 TaxID=3023480 RepID=UPI00398A5831